MFQSLVARNYRVAQHVTSENYEKRQNTALQALARSCFAIWFNFHYLIFFWDGSLIDMVGESKTLESISYFCRRICVQNLKIINQQWQSESMFCLVYLVIMFGLPRPFLFFYINVVTKGAYAYLVSGLAYYKFWLPIYGELMALDDRWQVDQFFKGLLDKLAIVLWWKHQEI